MSRQKMVRSILTAFRTLTILPIGGKDTDQFSSTLCFFPLVGAVLGLFVLLLYKGGAVVQFQHPAILALFALAAVTWLTGGLHIDGLGDVADAFGGGKTKEHILQILKDPRMGSFGVCAIVFAVLIKAWCWQAYFKQNDPWMIFWSLVFSRVMQGILVAFVPGARKESIAAPFGSGGRFPKFSVLVSYLMAGLAAAWSSSIGTAVICAGGSFAVTVLAGFYYWRRIQGITGDCVGATSELVEIAVLFGGLFLGRGR
jgi:adenosylcobinamide-GDP ribazoletransferase